MHMFFCAMTVLSYTHPTGVVAHCPWPGPPEHHANTHNAAPIPTSPQHAAGVCAVRPTEHGTMPHSRTSPAHSSVIPALIVLAHALFTHALFTHALLTKHPVQTYPDNKPHETFHSARPSTGGRAVQRLLLPLPPLLLRQRLHCHSGPAVRCVHVPCWPAGAALTGPADQQQTMRHTFLGQHGFAGAMLLHVACSQITLMVCLNHRGRPGKATQLMPQRLLPLQKSRHTVK